MPSSTLPPSDDDLTVPFDRKAHSLDAPTSVKRPRVVVANPADGGVLYWTAKLFGFAALCLIAALLIGVTSVYAYVSVSAPPIPDFTQYSSTASGVTRMYAADGTLLGEFAKERREIVPYERIPKKLIDAFLAVEDHEFFEHRR